MKSIAAIAVWLAAAILSAAEDPVGPAVFEQHCAACHTGAGVDRAPALAALQQMSSAAIYFALTGGTMTAQGEALSRQQMRSLVSWLSNPANLGDWPAQFACDGDSATVKLVQPAAMRMTGVNHENHRYLSAAQAGLSGADLGQLQLAWAVGFPQTSSLRSGGVVVGSTLYFSPTQTGTLLAMDTQSGCVKWSYRQDVPLRTSISFGRLGADGVLALIFADAAGQVHTVDPLTGKLIWKAEARHDPRVHITGAPVLFENRIIVPVSARGVGQGRDPNFECCTTHGAVVALDAATGKQLWTYHTMPDARYTGETNSLGVKLRGPSGAPIWSTPSIDPVTGVVYAATGEGTSLPATETSDAVLAIDLQTGQLRWSFQALANDIWNMACDIPTQTNGPNCPDAQRSVRKDYDFGAGPVLTTLNGRRYLLAGQKSGDVWALDPDANGKLLWRRTFGFGSALGGVHWGIAIDGERVFVPINDPVLPVPGYRPEPGMNAIDIATGQVLWRTPVAPDCSSERRTRYPRCGEAFGLSAAPLVIDDKVVAATTDGRIFIYAADTGKVVWSYDTLRSFSTLNNIRGEGGAIDSQSIFAGDGMLFVGSGYSGFRQPAGNVLLAFKAIEK